MPGGRPSELTLLESCKVQLYPRMTIVNVTFGLLSRIQSEVSLERFFDRASRLACCGSSVRVTIVRVVGAAAPSSSKDAIVDLWVPARCGGK